MLLKRNPSDKRRFTEFQNGLGKMKTAETYYGTTEK